MQNGQGTTPKLISIALIAAFSLSACGIKAPLKTPPPLWGKEKPAETKPASEDQKEENTSSQATQSKP